jgi:hypothetical protein
VAAATTPAPLPASESADQAHNGSGTIPGDRPEFPLPMYNDKRNFLTTPGTIDRPRTPPELSFEDSRALLTRLTGLQPWQLEAFPDELPPLPLSRPSSPLRSPDTGRPSAQFSQRRLSSTAVPIRFRKPPVSPVVQRELNVEPEPAPSSGSSPLRPRHVKAPSAEFKTSREFRPLYLLERNRKSDEIDEVLPALPSSGSPSRASSATETDAEYESALESPRFSASITPDDTFFEPLNVVSDLISSRPGPELQHPELLDREIEEIDESGQMTPKASDFLPGVPIESAGPARDVLAAALEDVKAKDSRTSRDENLISQAESPVRASPLAPSAPLDDSKMRGISTAQGQDASPSKSSSRLQNAALGAAIGGLTAATLHDKLSSPLEDSAELKREGDVDPEGKVSSDRKGKNKAKQAKSQKDVLHESPLPTPVEEIPDPKQAFPIFVDNEDDWVRNKSESVITDDATLVAEPTAGSSASKVLQKEKILESTAPQGSDDVEIQRAILDQGREGQNILPRNMESLGEFKLGNNEIPESTTAQALEAESDIPSVPLPLGASDKNLETTSADTRTEQEPVQATEAQVQALSTIPKGKKNKKGKKGKRESQQLEPASLALSEAPTQGDNFPLLPETEQEHIEHRVLEQALADREAKMDVMVALDNTHQTETRAPEERIHEISSEPSTTLEVHEDIKPQLPAIEPAISASGQPLSTVKSTEPSSSIVKEVPAVPEPEIEPEPAKPGWGNSLWGALGWGKKRAPSPTPTPEPKPAVAAPAVEKKSDLQPPPAPILSVEPRQLEVKPDVVEYTAPEFILVEEPAQHGTSDEVNPSRGIEEVGDEVTEPQPKATPAFIIPHITYFTDGGKPSFTFPVSSTITRPELARAQIEDVASNQSIDNELSTTSSDADHDILTTPQTTYSAIMPRTSFFTDDGKPHFMFPQVSAKATQELLQPTLDTDIKDDTPNTTYPVIMSQTMFFTDNGKPHFTFPQITAKATQELVQSPVNTDSKDDTPPTMRSESSAGVSKMVMPENAFFTDNGKPHFSFSELSRSLPEETVQELTTAIPEEESATAEPADLVSSKRKKSKKDKKKRGSIVTPATESGELDPKVETKVPLAASSETAIDHQVKQWSDDTVEGALAFDETTTLPRDAELDVKLKDEPLSEHMLRAVEPTTSDKQSVSASPEPHDVAVEQQSASMQETTRLPKEEVPELSATVEPTVMEPLTPVEEDLTTPSHKKKSKKAKKAKRESIQASALDQSEPNTPVTERSPDLPIAGPSDPSIDTSIDVPLPIATPQEEKDLAEPVPQLPKSITEVTPRQTNSDAITAASDSLTLQENVSPEPVRNIQDVQSEPVTTDHAPSVVVATAVEEDWSGYAPKRGKNEKSKTQSDTHTPEIQIGPVIEPVTTISDLLAPSRDLPQISKDNDLASEHPARDIVKEPLLEARPPEAVELALEEEKSPAVELGPAEQSQRELDTSPLVKQTAKVEAEAAASTSKKDKKKKKKGKKSKGTDTPTEETVELETATEAGATDKDVVQPEGVKLPEDVEGELQPLPEAATEPALPLSEITYPDNTKQAVPPAEDVEALPQSDTVFEPMTEDIVDAVGQTPSSSDFAQAEPQLDSIATTGQKSTPVTVQPADTVVEDESTVPTSSSKKDKKKKKGKKNRAVEESEPIALIAEGQRELEMPVEVMQPETNMDIAPLIPDQPVEQVAQPTTLTDVPNIAEDEPTDPSSLPIDRAIDVPPVLDESEVVPTQSAAPVEEEAAASSKKSRKKKGKKVKSIDVESMVLETTVEPEPSTTKPSAIERAPVQVFEEPAEVPLPLESSGELVSEPVEEPAEVPLPLETPGELIPEPVEEPAAVPLPLETPGELVPEPVEEPAAVPLPLETPGELVPEPVEEPAEVPLPLESPGELVSEPVEVVDEFKDPLVPISEDLNREVPETTLEEPVTTSKKSKKKKKGKKGTLVETEPSTPTTEEPILQFENTPDVAVADGPEDDAAPLQRDIVKDIPALSGEFKPALEPAQIEAEMAITPVTTHKEVRQDDAFSTAVELTAEADAVELTSKKTKKKKGKKAKSSDITEPSTPTSEELAMHLQVAGQPTIAEKNTDDMTQVSTGGLPATEAPTAIMEVEPSYESVPTTNVEEDTTLLTADPSVQNVTESPMVSEPISAEVPAESTSKKAKKKSKKAKAGEEKEPEPSPEALEDIRGIGTVPDATQPVEEALPTEASRETGSIADDIPSILTSEKPMERELATETGQSSKSVDLEIPMGDPIVETQVLLEASSFSELLTPQPKEPIANDEATPTSKRAKKKKGKKNASVSEPQTPTTEVDSFITAASTTHDTEAGVIPVEAPVIRDEVLHAEPEAIPLSSEGQTTEQTSVVLDKATPATEQPSAEDMGFPRSFDLATEEVQEQTVSTPLSKKDKKKAKKNKRASVIEETSSTSATADEEVSRELERQNTALEAPLLDESSLSQAVSPKPMPIEMPNEEIKMLTTTLEDAQPLVAVDTERSVDETEATSTQTEKTEAGIEQVQPVEEQTTTSKKSRKKAKKDKRTSIVESEPSTPIATPVQEFQSPFFDNQPVAVPEILAKSDNKVSTSVDLEPTSSAHVPEELGALATEILQEQSKTEPVAVEDLQKAEQGADDEHASMSKKDRKKAKTTKRVPIVEDSSIPGTPVEEKEILLEDQPISFAQLPDSAQEDASCTSIDAQSSILQQASEDTSSSAQATMPEEEQQPQQAPEGESTSLSKKDKKKAKKAKRVSIVEPASEPATPFEEKAEPNVRLEGMLVTTPTTPEESATEIPLIEEPLSTQPPAMEPVLTRDFGEENVAIVNEEPAIEVPVVTELGSTQLPVMKPISTENIDTENAATLLEEASSTPVSKQDKKKAKKAKRGSVVESSTLTPVETPVEEKTQDPLDVQQPTEDAVAEENAPETPVAEEVVPVVPVAEEVPVDVHAEEVAPVSKKDKKKSKKAAKRGSLVEPELPEPSMPLEQPVDDVKGTSVADQPVSTEPVVDEPAAAAISPLVEQPVVAPTDTAELEPSMIEPTTFITSEDQQFATPSIVQEPSEVLSKDSGIATETDPVPIAAPLSKKDKKKAKKSKRGSAAEPEVPEPSSTAEQASEQQVQGINEVEQPLMTAPVAEKPTVIALSHEQLADPSAEPPQPATDVLPAAALEENKPGLPAVTDVSETLVEPSTEQSTLAPSTAEMYPSLDRTGPLVSEAIVEPGNPTMEETEDIESEPAEWATLSKAQKKKAKKAKRTSVAESEPSQPAASVDGPSKELIVETESTVPEPTQDQDITVALAEVSSTTQPPTEDLVDTSTTLQKDKKRAKKSKGTLVTDDDLMQSVMITDEPSSQPAPSTEQAITSTTKDLTREPTSTQDKTTTAVPTEDSSVEPYVEPPVESVPAVAERADVPLSKKDKKKAKKAKRASGVEDQPSQPATPIEELAKELVVEDQAAIPMKSEEVINEEQPTAHETPPIQIPDEASATTAPVDSLEKTAPSKKDKKKAKKQQKASTTETVPFLALETSEEANVSDTQPSPPTSIPSETPLLLSGIPTSYPYVRDIAFGENGGETVRDVQKESTEVAKDIPRGVEVDVVGENELESKPDTDPPAGVFQKEELVVPDVDVEALKTPKKNEKQEATFKEPTIEPSATATLDTTLVEPLTIKNAEPAIDTTNTQAQDVLAEQPTASVESVEVQIPERQPTEQSRAYWKSLLQRSQVRLNRRRLKSINWLLCLS